MLLIRHLEYVSTIVGDYVELSVVNHIILYLISLMGNGTLNYCDLKDLDIRVFNL
jgi:hypothetical protein